MVAIPVAVNFTLTKFASGCPSEIAFYVYGFNRNDSEAKEEFNRIQMSPGNSNYGIPLVGFSWNSNVLWKRAKINAKENGPMLAEYIIGFHKNCPSTEIRLIAHSLGAAVVDESLVILSNNFKWKGEIASVHY